MGQKLPLGGSSRNSGAEGARRRRPATVLGRKSASRAALRDGEAQFAALLSEIPCPIALVRLADGVVLAASRDFAERFGHRLEDVVGASCGDLGLWSDVRRGRGVPFSLDDFGAGYSTLAHIRHLPVAEIKIDRSFVFHMLNRVEDLAIVEAVIRLGRAFGRSLVAEGVETAEHIARLLDLGCDVMQGFALARPMPAEDVPRWLRDFRPDPAWRRPDPALAH